MSTENKKKFIINAVYVVIWVMIVLGVIKYVLPATAPFVFAFAIAYLLRKPIRTLKRKINGFDKGISIIVLILFYSTIGVLTGVLLCHAWEFIGNLILTIPSLYAEMIEPWLNQMMHDLSSADFTIDPTLGEALRSILGHLIEYAGKLISNISVWTVGWISNTASAIPKLFLGFFIMIISSFFITIDYQKIVSFFLCQLSKEKQQLLLEVREYVSGTLFMCIRSYVLIMSLTFIELAIGLSILNIKYAVVIALCISVFDVLPVLGTGGIIIPWGLVALISKDWFIGFGLLALYLVITVVRNVVEPKIVGTQLGLHPVLTLLSMFVGVNLLGIIGLFGFPILLSLIKNLNDKGIIHWYKSV